MAFHDANARNVQAKRARIIEVWSFKYAVALHMMYCNFVKLHSKLKVALRWRLAFQASSEKSTM